MLTAFTNCTVISDGVLRPGKIVLVKDRIISGVLDNDQDLPEHTFIKDLNGAYLAPGLIDLQVYGSGGQLFGGDPTVQALAQMENDFSQQGTCGFLAAVATNDPAIVRRAISAAKQYRPSANGAFLGLHLEGPYLNPKFRGAHPESFIKKATLAEVKNWIAAADGEIKMMTIAPELQDEEILTFLDDHGVVLSCGHSGATYEQALIFFNQQVKAATHLYNAMPAIHHRAPGLVPAIFRSKPFTSIVADGVHVSFPMIELAKRELGNKLFLITDAVTETSTGIYPHVFTGDRYTMPHGTLSGSCLTMLTAVKNCVNHAGISLAEAINMASLYPAQLMGMEARTGKIKPGYAAKLVMFNKDYEVLATQL